MSYARRGVILIAMALYDVLAWRGCIHYIDAIRPMGGVGLSGVGLLYIANKPGVGLPRVVSSSAFPSPPLTLPPTPSRDLYKITRA